METRLDIKKVLRNFGLLVVIMFSVAMSVAAKDLFVDIVFIVAGAITSTIIILTNSRKTKDK